MTELILFVMVMIVLGLFDTVFILKVPLISIRYIPFYFLQGLIYCLSYIYLGLGTTIVFLCAIQSKVQRIIK